MKRIGRLLSLFLFFLSFTYADVEPNNDISHIETISQMNNISNAKSYTANGSVSSSDTDDYYKFTILADGVLTIGYTSSDRTDLRMGTNVAFLSRVLNNGSSYAATVSIKANDTIYLRVTRRSGSPTYSIAFNFTPDAFKGNNVREFSSAFQANTNGDVKIIGNSVIVGGNNNQCPGNSTRNNDINAKYAVIDAGTTNSSSADLNLPAGSTVLWAGLYWQGYLSSPVNSVRNVKLKIPGETTYRLLEAEADKLNWVYFDANRFMYQGSVDVTDIVKISGSGTYTVADVATQTGQPAGGAFGAWSIVVAYKNDSESLKNISIYDGYQAVSSSDASKPDVYTEKTINLSGFLTPANGVVNSKFLMFVGEGDITATGDTVAMTDKSGVSKYIYDALNPQNDIMNSTVTENGQYVTSRNPNCQNTIGIDIDTFNVGNKLGSLGIISNSQTSTSVKFKSAGDGYFPGVLAFSTDLYVPDVCYEEEITKDGVTPDFIRYGDELDINVMITNKNYEPAKGVVIKKQFDDSLEYVRGSASVMVGNYFVPKTDALDADTVNYDDSISKLIMNLGAGATATSGGAIVKDQIEKFHYKFRVQKDGSLTNEYKVSYRDESGVGEQSTYSDVAIGKCSNRSVTYTTISVLPVGKVRVVETGKGWNDNGGALYTKLVGPAVSFDILYATDNTGATLTTGKIKKLELFDYSSGSIGALLATPISSLTTIAQRYTFSMAFAAAYKRVVFVATLEDGSSTISNDFTVRPASFTGDVSGFRAGELGSVASSTIKALKYASANAATGYNTVLGIGSVTAVTLASSDKCKSNTVSSMLQDINITFVDGLATKIDGLFKDVGTQFSVSLADSSWIANSDDPSNGHCIVGSSSNTPDGNGKIGCNIGGVINVTVLPYDIKAYNITQDALVYRGVSGFPKAGIKTDLKATAKDGSLTQNFSKDCYSSDVSLDIATIISGGKTLSDIGFGSNITKGTNKVTALIPASDFLYGSTTLNIDFYSNKTSISSVEEPFDVNASTFKAYSSGFGYSQIDFGKNTYFLYGKVAMPNAIVDYAPNVTVRAYAEVYAKDASKLPVGASWVQAPGSSEWWINTFDGSSVISAAYTQKSDKLSKLQNEVGTISLSPISNGIFGLTLSPDANNDQQIRVHLDVPTYLWYGSKPYNFDVNTDCSQHPCALIDIYGTAPDTSWYGSGDTGNKAIQTVPKGKRAPKVNW